jgi:hypothetical protein
LLRRAAAQIGYLWFHTGCLEKNAAFAARIGCVPYILVPLGLNAPHASVSVSAAFRRPMRVFWFRMRARMAGG